MFLVPVLEDLKDRVRDVCDRDLVWSLFLDSDDQDVDLARGIFSRSTEQVFVESQLFGISKLPSLPSECREVVSRLKVDKNNPPGSDVGDKVDSTLAVEGFIVYPLAKDSFRIPDLEHTGRERMLSNRSRHPLTVFPDLFRDDRRPRMDLIQLRFGFLPSLCRLPVGRARLRVDEAKLIVQVLDHDERLLEGLDSFQDKSMCGPTDDQRRTLRPLDFPPEILGLIVPRRLSEDLESRSRDSEPPVRDVVISRVLFDQETTLWDLCRRHDS